MYIQFALRVVFLFLSRFVTISSRYRFHLPFEVSSIAFWISLLPTPSFSCCCTCIDKNRLLKRRMNALKSTSVHETYKAIDIRNDPSDIRTSYKRYFRTSYKRYSTFLIQHRFCFFDHHFYYYLRLIIVIHLCRQLFLSSLRFINPSSSSSRGGFWMDKGWTAYAFIVYVLVNIYKSYSSWYS